MKHLTATHIVDCTGGTSKLSIKNDVTTTMPAPVGPWYKTNRVGTKTQVNAASRLLLDLSVERQLNYLRLMSEVAMISKFRAIFNKPVDEKK